MKIAVAIPTFNRVEYLRKAVQSVLDQVHDHGVELYTVISNIASTDGTGDYLDQLNKDHENVIVYNQPEDNRKFPNPYFLASVIPDDIDWVWLMGDDDYLMQKNTVQDVSRLIRNHQQNELCLIHACQGGRSRSTRQVRVGEIFDLCNEFGYHEMLGWFSSIVLRRSEFVDSMNELKETHHYMRSDTLEGRSNYSAFAHSAAIYKQCVGKKSLFVDWPLVDPQDRKQTEKTAKRWAVENTPERYLFVADDLQRLKDLGLIKNKCSRLFFRYLTVNFWDLWLSYLMSLLIDKEKTEAELTSEKFLTEWNINLDRIMKVTELLDDPNDIKQLSYMHLNVKYMAGCLSNGKFFDRAALDAISEQIQTLIVPSYNFSFFAFE
ncbi:MAG: glycosyltransferase family 2 protein [Verrucomicrobia bacterium]|nr:glycosyltransferase family 2 protein [Verrucomicrobiota bacterium]